MPVAIATQEMDTAKRLISWAGHEQELVHAHQIKSQSDARKLAPFIDTARKPMYWVGWSKPRKATGKKTRPHFSHYPHSRYSMGYFRSVEEEVSERKKFAESPVHKTAKDSLHAHLCDLLSRRADLRWAFKDERVSEFPLTGNLLAGVEAIEKEYVYKTSFGFEYKFDIALLGPQLSKSKERLLLGAVELEKENRFGMLKCLVCKALGFPMTTVNLEGLKAEDISDAWVRSALTETTATSEDGLRRNYVYVHNALYPVYMDMPDHVRGDDRHQFIVFCKEGDYLRLNHCLEKYRERLGLEKEILIDHPRIKPGNAQSEKMFINEGSIAGANWRDYNEEHYFRIQMKVPVSKQGPLYLFHIVLSRLLNSHFDTLCGYKPARRQQNSQPDNPFWTFTGSSGEEMLVAPKQLSEHLKPVIDFLSANGIFKGSMGNRKHGDHGDQLGEVG